MKKGFFLVAAVIFIWGCEPKPDSGKLVTNLAVITDHDNTVNFSSYNTYLLTLDTVSYFNSSDDNLADTLLVDTPGSDYLVDYVTTAVNAKMVSAGFNKVNSKSSPDLRVYIFIVENYNVGYSYYPYSYGYYYGGYYSQTVSDVADLYIQILDLKHRVGGKPSLIWYCDISDLVSAPTGTSLSNAIEQAFNQSTYLKK